MTPPQIRPRQRLAHVAPLIAGLSAITMLVITSCSTSTVSPVAKRNDDTADRESFPFIHGVRVFVSAVNCEMNTEDAARINALATTPGLTLEIVFTGVSNNDTSVVALAQADLGLTVPVRLVRPHELEQYKSIGGAPLPMALVVKGRQLKTIVAGESMPRTMSILEASLSSIAPQNNHPSPEG